MSRETWHQRARAIIHQLHGELPADMPFKERRQAVRAAYPWGSASWPHKQWRRAQREYLAPYAPQRPMDFGLFEGQEGPEP